MTALTNKSAPAKRVVWLACVLLLLAVAVIGVPNFIRARSTSCCNACINNLRQVDAAANQLSLHDSNHQGIWRQSFTWLAVLTSVSSPWPRWCLPPLVSTLIEIPHPACYRLDKSIIFVNIIS